jgi:hypothetical protein
MIIAMKDVNHGTNPLTVLIESVTAEDDSDYHILQHKGEAFEDPVLLASRASGTIVYTVQPENDSTSRMNLLATNEPITTSVSERYFQTANSFTHEDKVRMMATDKMWILGSIELDLSRGADLPASQLPVEVEQTVIHQGHKTAHVAALLLTQRFADTEAIPDPDAWKDWDFTEKTSLDKIIRMSEDATCKFRIVSRMEKNILSLDVYNTSKNAEFRTSIADERRRCSSIHRCIQSSCICLHLRHVLDSIIVKGIRGEGHGAVGGLDSRKSRARTCQSSKKIE